MTTRNGKRWTAEEDKLYETKQKEIIHDLIVESEQVRDPVEKAISLYMSRREKVMYLKPTWYFSFDQKLDDLAALLQRSVGSIRARWSHATTTETKNKDKNPKLSGTSKKRKTQNNVEETKTSLAGLPEIDYKWDGEQARVMEAIVEQRQSVFFTGPAGTGKSVLLQEIIKKLRARNLEVGVTAPTGLAACNVGGRTLHEFSGWRPNDEYQFEADDLVRFARQKVMVARRWRKLDVLVIDEISMVSAAFFEKLDAMVRILRNRREIPFGGIQLVICGDFFQLPPIINRPGITKQFCFEADNWNECVTREIELQKVYRQQDDDVFRSILNEIRVGQCSSASLKTLQTRLVDPEEIKNKSYSLTDIIPTALYSHRANVAEQNAKCLEMLTTSSVLFPSTDTGYTDKLKSCSVPESLTLKIGAQVVLLKNLDNLKSGLSNGARGVVIGFVRDLNSIKSDRTFPQVKFYNGIIRTITPEKFRLMNGNKEIACRIQIPLDLAWGLTVHRSQGMTLDCAEVDLGHCFESGQTYVGLSRVRTLQGLSIRSFDPKRIKAHPKVLAFHTKKRIIPQQSPPPQSNTTLAALTQACHPNEGGIRHPVGGAAICNPALIPLEPAKSEEGDVLRKRKRNEQIAGPVGTE